MQSDVRLLQERRELNGRRTMHLVEAIPQLRGSDMPGWAFVGPRVVREWLQKVQDGPGTMVSCHAEWVRLSGALGGGSQAHEHRHLCETVRLALSTDQVDVSNLA